MNSIMMSLKNGLGQKRVRNVLIGLYVLLIIGLSASARAEVQILQQVSLGLHQSTELQSFVGEVVRSDAGYLYLVTENATYELQSTQNLASFEGQLVEVTGMEIKYKNVPAYQLVSVTPLQTEDDRLPAVPVVIVYDVSLVE